MFNEPWTQMWALVIAILMTCKWVGLRLHRVTLPGPALVQYCFTWPGLDPRPFRRHDETKPIPWQPGAAKLVLGLFGFVLARLLWPAHGAVWIAMVSSLLVAHFGLVHLLCVWHRRRGIAVDPLMARPLLATSLTDFWGRRWNTVFRDFAYTLVFRPVARRWGARAGSVAVFAFSGVVHDLTISVPAGGGYGLPTLFFLLQALGVFLEKRFQWGGWWWTLLWMLPMPWLLFHPLFVERVMRPFYERILFL